MVISGAYECMFPSCSSTFILHIPTSEGPMSVLEALNVHAVLMEVRTTCTSHEIVPAAPSSACTP